MTEPPSSEDDDLYWLPFEKVLSLLQLSTLLYYLHETNPDNGLVRDKTDPKAPVSIAAVGMALATIPVVVERGVIIREFAAKITQKRLRYLLQCPQGPEPDATGYKGFFYHFLDIETGRRVWKCELSTIDSAFLFAGAVTVATYFDRDTADEAEIRSLADTLYRRADWNWACDGGPTLTHGWRPETGFMPHRWRGYDEGLLLYILGLGSPTYPLPPESYRAYCATYQWKTIYDRELLYSGPLFTHQLSHMWIDFRGIRDDFMRARGSDYFENSRQATFVQQEYAIRNPMNFAGYGPHCWGFTACDGPGWCKRVVDGVEREFFDYVARGAPFGPDDGTVGRRRLAPLRAGDRDPDGAPFCPDGPWNDGQVRLQALVQPIVPGGRQPDRLVGHAAPLRDRSRARGTDDRELPHGPALGHHASVHAGVDRLASRRLCRGLVVTWAALGRARFQKQNWQSTQAVAQPWPPSHTSPGSRTPLPHAGVTVGTGVGVAVRVMVGVAVNVGVGVRVTVGVEIGV